jgi:hypothetical protein
MSAQGQAQRRPGYARRTNPEALKGRNKTSEFKYEQNDDRTSSPGSSSLFRPVGAREEVCGLMFPGRWPGLT